MFVHQSGVATELKQGSGFVEWSGVALEIWLGRSVLLGSPSSTCEGLSGPIVRTRESSRLCSCLTLDLGYCCFREGDRYDRSLEGVPESVVRQEGSPLAWRHRSGPI